MKKMVTLVTAFVLGISMCCPVFAADVPSTQTVSVEAKYAGDTTKSTVYSVEITWDDMEFVYSVTGSEDWDPSTHAYVESTTDSWSSGKGISITNHSNASVTANFTFDAKATYPDVAGSFSLSQIQLASAEGTAVADAPTGSTTLTLSGELDQNVMELTEVGTVTISLAQ